MKRSFVIILLALVISCCGLGRIVQADLNDGLVAYYPFNGNANDESGNESDGVVNGAVLIKDRLGNADSAYSFDGIDDHIFISETNHPTGEVTVTYSAWIYLESDRSNDAVIIDIGSGRGSDVSNERSSILIEANNTCITYIGEYNDIQPTTACVLENQWVFIALTKSERNVKFFINGGLQYSATHGSGQNVSNTQMNIGLAKDYSTNSGYEPFLGFIDEVRIYNRALSESEIQELYRDENLSDKFCTVNGTIFDTVTGSVIPGVTLTFTSSEFDNEYQANSDGAFNITDIPVGTYQVQISAEGYQPEIYDTLSFRNEHEIRCPF